MSGRKLLDPTTYVIMPTCSWTVLYLFLAVDIAPIYNTVWDVGSNKRRNTQEHKFSTDCDVRNLPDLYMCLIWKLESDSLNRRRKGSDSKLWGHILLCGWWQWSSDTVGNPADVTYSLSKQYAVWSHHHWFLQCGSVESINLLYFNNRSSYLLWLIISVRFDRLIGFV